MKFISISVLFLFLAITGEKDRAALNSYPEVDGYWNVQLRSNDIGTVNTILEFETSSDGSFKGWTRKSADRDILGFWKSTLARIFTSDFKNGSLIRITDGTIESNEDALILSGIFRSAMGNYYFNGEIIDNQMQVELKDGNFSKTGALFGEKVENRNFPLNDYQSIVSKAIDETKKRIYNREVLETRDWESFEKDLTGKAGKFQDDIDLVFAFFYFARELPFSHYALTRMEPAPGQTAGNEAKQYLSLEEKDNRTALLTISSFSGTATEVDSVFSVIFEKDYKNLIVDLRNNTGGTVESGMAFARRIVDTPLTGGFFLTQKWFNENDFIPDSNQLDELPVFSEANYDLIIEGINREKGLVLKVQPSDVNFKGNLFILTNNQTASTCEPIVHGLKTTGRATIVGERTAGAMLNGERFELSSGFSLFVPTADYYTTDGFRIDQNGVKPNIKLKDKDPVEYVMRKLIE